jgi:hypothetical protein
MDIAAASPVMSPVMAISREPLRANVNPASAPVSSTSAVVETQNDRPHVVQPLVVEQREQSRLVGVLVLGDFDQFGGLAGKRAVRVAGAALAFLHEFETEGETEDRSDQRVARGFETVGGALFAQEFRDQLRVAPFVGGDAGEQVAVVSFGLAPGQPVVNDGFGEFVGELGAQHGELRG